MKKLAFVLAVIISLSMIPSFASAAQVPIKVEVDGTKVNFPDAQPFIDSNGRTQTPVKFIGEALGATVTWDSKGQRALFVLDGKELILYIGKKEYTLDGQKKQMDTAALLKAGRTFVPAKYVAEAFGATVKWNSSIKTVYVNMKPIEAGLGVTVGTQSGATGTTITVPITFKNVAKAGNVGTCNLYLKYDSAVLEAVSVTAGDIVVSSDINFSSLIDPTAGGISILFLDQTIGSQLITNDGVFANVTFKVIGTSSVTSPVTFNEGGAFGNGEMKKITEVTRVEGSVKAN